LHAESATELEDSQMKKRTRGFWNWIIGSGWEGGGSNG
jgi:hypothetical protein